MPTVASAASASSRAQMLERCGAGTQPELHLMAGAVAEHRLVWRQQRHRALLVRVSPAGWRVALPVAERVHGLEVAMTNARLVDAAVGVQLVRLRRPCGPGFQRPLFLVIVLARRRPDVK